jgi:hypothetical protein
MAPRQGSARYLIKAVQDRANHLGKTVRILARQCKAPRQGIGRQLGKVLEGT